MSGLDLFEAAKNINPAVAAIMITGAEDRLDAIAQESVHRDDCACVRKPLDVDDILNLLDRYPIDGAPAP